MYQTDDTIRVTEDINLGSHGELPAGIHGRVQDVSADYLTVTFTHDDWPLTYQLRRKSVTDPNS